MKVQTTGLGNIHVKPMVKYLLRLKDYDNNFNPKVAKSAQITLHRTTGKTRSWHLTVALNWMEGIKIRLYCKSAQLISS